MVVVLAVPSSTCGYTYDGGNSAASSFSSASPRTFDSSGDAVDPKEVQRFMKTSHVPKKTKLPVQQMVAALSSRFGKGGPPAYSRSGGRPPTESEDEEESYTGNENSTQNIQETQNILGKNVQTKTRYCWKE